MENEREEIAMPKIRPEILKALNETFGKPKTRRQFLMEKISNNRKQWGLSPY